MIWGDNDRCVCSCDSNLADEIVAVLTQVKEMSLPPSHTHGAPRSQLPFRRQQQP